MKEVVLLSAARTPVGKFLGALKSLSATQLGSIAVRAAVERSGLAPDQIEEVILGNVVSAGLGQNPARQAALGAGLPVTVPALTINKVCGSGLKAVMLAAQAIQTAQSEFVVAGGTESMSNAPYLLPRMRGGLRLGDGRMLDAMISDGLWDAYEDFHMGCTGEIVARQYEISRDEQDRYAFESHRKAVAAIRQGLFKREIVAVSVQKQGASLVVDTDESPREDTSLEALARLKPAFEPEGTVTAGNAPGVNDGAAALVLASTEAAWRLGKTPRARIVAYASSGIEPRLVMLAPIEAVRRVWQKTGWSAGDVDLYELNEAFSVQSIALIRELGLDPTRVNVRGGAVAIGHPIGASGARVLVTLLHALEDGGGRRGIAALCLGGGNAVALAIERRP
ncbi:MAG: acetyl-CoA C-acetyltransferase [Acidobacteriota bacterium]